MAASESQWRVRICPWDRRSSPKVCLLWSDEEKGQRGEGQHAVSGSCGKGLPDSTLLPAPAPKRKLISLNFNPGISRKLLHSASDEIQTPSCAAGEPGDWFIIGLSWQHCDTPEETWLLSSFTETPTLWCILWLTINVQKWLYLNTSLLHTCIRFLSQ